jgi:hypothetical protein
VLRVFFFAQNMIELSEENFLTTLFQDGKNAVTQIRRKQLFCLVGFYFEDLYLTILYCLNYISVLFFEMFRLSLHIEFVLDMVIMKQSVK